MKTNKMKGLLKIKWENIITIILLIFNIISIISHIKLNGYYIELGLETIIYLTFTFTLKYLIKDIRKNYKDYFID